MTDIMTIVVVNISWPQSGQADDCPGIGIILLSTNITDLSCSVLSKVSYNIIRVGM